MELSDNYFVTEISAKSKSKSSSVSSTITMSESIDTQSCIDVKPASKVSCSTALCMPTALFCFKVRTHTFRHLLTLLYLHLQLKNDYKVVIFHLHFIQDFKNVNNKIYEIIIFSFVL